MSKVGWFVLMVVYLWAIYFTVIGSFMCLSTFCLGGSVTGALGISAAATLFMSVIASAMALVGAFDRH